MLVDVFLLCVVGANECFDRLDDAPFALLLETITAICVPVLVGARTHFASAVAENVGAASAMQ